MYKRLQLVILFLLVLGVKLSLAGQTPYMFGDDSYYHMRQVESIRSSGQTVGHDSIVGGKHVLSPLFDYILALFTLFMPPDAVYKFVPNVLASTLVIIAYYVAYTTTKDHHTSILTAAMAGFIPVFFAKTFNMVSVYSLVIPLMALLIYFFLHLEDGVLGYVITLIILSLLHPTVLVFVFGLLMYAVITSVEGMPLTEKEKETILFSIIFVLWSQFLMYKHVFIAHAGNVIYQNIPARILSNYFVDFNILDAIYKIDAVPFLFALYAMRQYVFKIANKTMHFLISMCLTIGLIVWLKLIPLTVGLMFLGMIMVLVMPKAYQHRIKLLGKSRISKAMGLWKGVFFVFFLITAVGSSLHLAYGEAQNSIEDEHTALQWLQENSKPDDIIMSDIEDSQKIMSIAKRRTVLDSDFLLVKNSETRYEDIRLALTSQYITLAGDKLEKYGADYVYLSPDVMEGLGISILPSHDQKCLPLVYNTTVQIYKWECALELR